MDLSEKLNKTDWRLSIDFFRHEARNFGRDIEVVVLGTLNAGLKQLKADFDKRSTILTQRYEKARDEEQRDWLVDEDVDLKDGHEDQERFLRNMAAVALLSRLTHTLNNLARSGENFGPRADSAYLGENEFARLWREYDERFGIKFNAKHIQWIEPLRKARNLVIHNGGQANPLKPQLPNSRNKNVEELRDYSFSKKYRQFVEGKGDSAQVTINDKQLKFALNNAVELTNWLAVEMRSKQMEFFEKKQKTIRKSSARKR
ncbi:MAG: hypothetical protein JWQ49_194 [Edaphobacter sp.]|nr:hypothetical protein [Edaphobacter sp.]